MYFYKDYFIHNHTYLLGTWYQFVFRQVQSEVGIKICSEGKDLTICIYIHTHTYTYIHMHTVLHCVVFHIHAVCCVALYSIYRQCVVLRCIPYTCSVLHCVVFHIHAVCCVALYYTYMQCIALRYKCVASHCITLHHIIKKCLHCFIILTNIILQDTLTKLSFVLNIISTRAQVVFSLDV